MPRPIEYDNLIKTRALEPVQPTPGAVTGFLKNADNFLALSKALQAGTPLATEPMQVFTNAYEGYTSWCKLCWSFTRYAQRNLAARSRFSVSVLT